jgi:hypothetical protein
MEEAEEKIRSGLTFFEKGTGGNKKRPRIDEERSYDDDGETRHP